MTADVRMEVRVRNNLILKKIEAAGYKTTADLLKAMKESGIKVTAVRIYRIIAMKDLPEGRHGTWYPDIEKLAMFLKCSPEELFSAKQRSTKLDDNRAVAEIEYETFERIAVSTPEQLLLSKEMQDLLSKHLCQLPARMERVLRLRYWDQQSGNQIADTLGVTRERAYQLEKRALKKLKAMETFKQLADYTEDFK